MTILETDRIILREFELTDYKSVYEFNSNLQVQKYTGDEIIQSEERAKELITKVSKKDYEHYGYGRWAAVYKPENRIIGFAGLKYIPELKETDIGFRFLPEYWGKGIATEISIAIIKYGFESLNLDRIIGIAMPENIGSCRVLEKIGLKFFKIDDYENDGGSYHWFAINKEQYISSKAVEKV